jgi:leucyl/phenylalanyl-tRNA--protein transferase
VIEPSATRFWIPPDTADAEGLVGVGGDLKPATLLRAYSEGVFPWFSEGDPILWWSPDPRAVIELDGLHVSRSLARTIRSGKFRISVNEAFGEVVRGCATRRDDETWITPDMIAAYQSLHRAGLAHSVEAWVPTETGDGWFLGGGIYGVAVGAFFAGESMFFRVTDGSKVAIVALVERLRSRGFELFDVQMRTEHTTRLGAKDIRRAEYLRRLRAAVQKRDVRFADG